MKEKTKSEPISVMEVPPFLFVPLPERFGSKPRPLVKTGDPVKRYQLIADSREGSPYRIHSPVSGIVVSTEKFIQTDGSMAPVIIIKNDFRDTSEKLFPVNDTCSSESILKAIENAGIVGMGGAEFPTALKYKTDGEKVDTFIINGTECEPYLTGDFSLMKEYPREILEGILFANRILQAREVVICIEKHNEELADIFIPLLDTPIYKNIRIQILPNEYPQGGELQLTRSVTGIKIPKGRRPLDFGIIMSNVGTIYAIYEAVTSGKPVVERVLTVSGEEAEISGNFLVRIGTPVDHILKCIKSAEKEVVVTVGGPMMGPPLPDLHAPISKGSLGIILLKNSPPERLNCIWCNYCVNVCPMYLMPMKYEELYRKGQYKKMEKYNLQDCIECSSCEYICPSNVPLMKSIKEGKNKLKELKHADD